MRPASVRVALTALLSLPQCNADLSKIHSTLTSIDQSPVSPRVPYNTHHVIPSKTVTVSQVTQGRVEQCFSTAGPRPGTGPCLQLYRDPRSSIWICHFSFLSNFSRMNILCLKYSEKNNVRECLEKLRPRCWPEETTICYQISLVQWLIINLNVLLYF
jgi:hypothetical protein